MAEKKSKNQICTDEIKKEFLEYYQETDEKDLYYSDDVERARHDNWFVKRFVLHHGRNKSRALEGLKRTLKWRKEHNVRDLTLYTFPLEAFLVNAIRPLFGNTKEGFRIVLVRLSVFEKEHRELVQNLIIFYLEEFEKVLDEMGVILFDVSDAGLQNVDLDLAYKMVTQLYNHYPYRLAGMYVYGMSWVFQAAYGFIRPFLPERASDRLIFVDKSDIQKHFDLSVLPLHMGGSVDISKPYVPPERLDEIEDPDEVIPFQVSDFLKKTEDSSQTTNL